MKVHKELQPLVDRARRHGWTVEVCNGGHIRFVNPEGRSFFTAATPSDFRAVKNFEATLRREGLPRSDDNKPCTKKPQGLTCHRCGSTENLTYLVRGYFRVVGKHVKRASVLRATCPKHGGGKTKRDMDTAGAALLGGACEATEWYVCTSRDDADETRNKLREQVSRT